MNKLKFLLPLLFLSGLVLSAQETASAFFDQLSQFYGTIEDYSGEVTITKGDVVQTANIYYRTPNMLRLDYTDDNSKGIVLNTNGETLTLFIPNLAVSFSQPLSQHSQQTLANMANSQGLHLLRENYFISYKTGPTTEPLDPESTEMVTKLKLDWSSDSEAFRRIELAIGENKVIRRITATTTKGTLLQFDFVNLAINQGIPVNRFNYEPPPVGNDIQNFLFEPEG